MPGCEEPWACWQTRPGGSRSGSAWVAEVSGTDMAFDPGFLDEAETNGTLSNDTG
jgi:hypothetical protein